MCSYNFFVERKLLHNFYFLVSCPCLLGIAHMHFIANSYKRFSKTTSTSPRQQVPLKYKKCIQMFNFQKNSFKSVHQCNKKLWPFKVFIFSAHSTGTIDALFEFYLFICIYTTEAMFDLSFKSVHRCNQELWSFYVFHCFSSFNWNQWQRDWFLFQQIISKL